MFRRALIYFSPVICSAALAAPLTLTNAAQVRALSQTEAAQKIPVRLRGVVIDEGVGRVETTALFGHEFPQMQVLLRPAHLFGLTSTRVGEREEI